MPLPFLSFPVETQSQGAGYLSSGFCPSAALTHTHSSEPWSAGHVALGQSSPGGWESESEPLSLFINPVKLQVNS